MSWYGDCKESSKIPKNILVLSIRFIPCDGSRDQHQEKLQSIDKEIAGGGLHVRPQHKGERGNANRDQPHFQDDILRSHYSIPMFFRCQYSEGEK